ncbi:AAA family ATPase [Megalodesulfovibrio paquesii]
MKRQMIFVLGLPGAGKSRYVEQHFANRGGVSVICFDLLRRAMGHEYHRSVEPAVEFLACTMARVGLSMGHTVVLDESITDPSLAAALVDIAREHEAGVAMVYLDTPVQQCRDRRVPHGFPEADFDRKVAAWGAHGRTILRLADTLATIRPLAGTVGGVGEVEEREEVESGELSSPEPPPVVLASVPGGKVFSQVCSSPPSSPSFSSSSSSPSSFGGEAL